MVRGSGCLRPAWGLLPATLWGWDLCTGLPVPLLPTLDFPKAVATSLPLRVGMCPPNDLISLPGRAAGCCCVPARQTSLVRAKADVPSPPSVPLLIHRILVGPLCCGLSTGAVWLLLLAPLRCNNLDHSPYPDLASGSAVGRNGLSLLVWLVALCWLRKARGKRGWIWGVNLACCSSSPFNAKIPL